MILLVRLYQIILILLQIDGQTFDIVGKIISNYTEIITIYGQAQNIIGKIIPYYTDITTIDGQTQILLVRLLYTYNILERVIVESIIPRNVIINRGAAEVDNHISRDDFFHYHPLKNVIFILSYQTLFLNFFYPFFL